MAILSENSPVTFSDPLPAAVDVVIIGAGIIGISTAWFLSRRGVSVLVCEKGRVAGEQSSRNWGWVRQQGRDPAELPIMIESIKIWDRLAQETGEDLGFTRQGVMYMADDEQKLAAYEQWLEIAKQHQLDSRLLSSSEVDDLITEKPGQTLAGALYTPSDGRAEPFKAVPGLARATQREGAKIIENCAVRTVETEAGAVNSVVTELGQVKTKAVVCAAGAWAALFVRQLGIDLPQLTVKSCVARTAPAPNIFDGDAAFSDLAFRRRQDGGYTIALGDYQEHFISRDSFRHFFKFIPSYNLSKRETHLRLRKNPMASATGQRSWSASEITPFEKIRVLNPATTPETLQLMRQRMSKRLPSLAAVAFEESWAGMIDTMPDIVPVMDAVAQPSGFYLAAGFSGHGFGIGPGAGQVMADLVQGNPVSYDLTRFRLSRFSDGSAIDLGPTL